MLKLNAISLNGHIMRAIETTAFFDEKGELKIEDLPKIKKLRY